LTTHLAVVFTSKNKIMEHWFWFGLLGVTILWYIIVTIVVAIRGGKDIKEMIRQLKK